MIVCTEPLVARADGDAERALEWRQLAPGQLLDDPRGRGDRRAHRPAARSRRRGARWRPARAEPRTFEVIHRTVYKYDAAGRALDPPAAADARARPPAAACARTSSTISVPTQGRDYEDVFGNRVRRLAIETPFTEMVIEARSVVEVLDVDPLGFGPLRVRSTIPLVWMPWQRQILEPYLLPPELPETELAELAEYAMSFVKRNDYDLLDTLLDINQTIFREYAYQQGATNVLTTRVRRLRQPARRVPGLHEPDDLPGAPARRARALRVRLHLHRARSRRDHARQGEASHAWVQLYLPQVGWKGFDPTNGILTQTDHVRVAVGRNYLDATPTSGTIFVGGGGETLAVDVTVEPFAG